MLCYTVDCGGIFIAEVLRTLRNVLNMDRVEYHSTYCL